MSSIPKVSEGTPQRHPHRRTAGADGGTVATSLGASYIRPYHYGGSPRQLQLVSGSPRIGSSVVMVAGSPRQSGGYSGYKSVRDHGT